MQEQAALENNQSWQAYDKEQFNSLYEKSKEKYAQTLKNLQDKQNQYNLGELPQFEFDCDKFFQQFLEGTYRLEDMESFIFDQHLTLIKGKIKYLKDIKK